MKILEFYVEFWLSYIIFVDVFVKVLNGVSCGPMASRLSRLLVLWPGTIWLPWPKTSPCTASSQTRAKTPMSSFYIASAWTVTVFTPLLRVHLQKRCTRYRAVHLVAAGFSWSEQKNWDGRLRAYHLLSSSAFLLVTTRWSTKALQWSKCIMDNSGSSWDVTHLRFSIEGIASQEPAKGSFPQDCLSYKTKNPHFQEPPLPQANRDIGHPRCGRPEPSRMRPSHCVCIQLFCHHRNQELISPFETQ